MDFTSIEYLGFLLGVTFIFYSIRPSFRVYLLLLAGYCFYALIQWQYCILLFFMSLYTYFAGQWLSANPNNKAGFAACIFVIFIPLFFFKFHPYFIENKPNTPNLDSFTELVFPIGLSFYSFQMVSYLVDIHRKYLKPEQNLAKVLLHHAFFPILLAGPIERTKKLVSQFEFKTNFEYENVRNGLFQILWGIFKKIVIANNLAFYVSTIYKNLSFANGLEVYLAMIFFVFQIIIDFSAYNDIAMGSAMLFGVKITKNIQDRAYASTSRTELWQRWHVSLTSWLRDYIFFPLSKFSKNQVWLYCNILIVYLVSGLWHGANWGFILWGLGNGIWLILEQISKKKRFTFFEKLGILKYPILFNFAAWFIFINASAFFDVFFLSDNFKDAIDILKQLFSNHTFSFYAGKRVIVIIFCSLFLLEIINRFKGENEIFEVLPALLGFRWFIYIALLVGVFYLGPIESQLFYYFRF
jgi:alginate O-acetyltransferase complex protein AlgI